MMSSLIALNVEVSIALQKLVYAVFIEKDAYMIEPDYQTNSIKTCKVRNLNMIEELAEIDYIFCDKTGTLTQNQLVFDCASIFTRDHRIVHGTAETLVDSVRSYLKSDNNKDD